MCLSMSKQRSVAILGTGLRLVRERTGRRVTDLAELVGVLPQTISNIEAGRKNPSPALWARICEALGIPQDALMLPQCQDCPERTAA